MKELEEFEKIMEVQRSLAENLSLVIPGRVRTFAWHSYRTMKGLFFY